MFTGSFPKWKILPMPLPMGTVHFRPLAAFRFTVSIGEVLGARLRMRGGCQCEQAECSARERASGLHDESLRHGPRQGRLAAEMTISTRRFCALPCGVSLLATGRASPKPWAEMVAAGTPLAVR